MCIRDRFFVVPRGKKTKLPTDVEFPLLVKSALEDASLGITKDSIVNDYKQLKNRVQFIHEDTETDALVESFIQGRELYVGVIGNRQLKVYPIWEMVFENAKPGDPRIATSRVKWDIEHQKKLGIETVRAKGISKKVEAKIQSLSLIHISEPTRPY